MRTTDERFEDLQKRLDATQQRMNDRKRLKVSIHDYLEWNTNREMYDVVCDYCNSNNVDPSVVEDVIRNSSRIKSTEDYPYWRLN